MGIYLKDSENSVQKLSENDVRYVDFEFNDVQIEPNANSLIIMNTIGASINGLTGYHPFSAIVKDGNQVGNGMTYTCHLAAETSVYIRVYNYNGNYSYTAQGTLRVGYVKQD